MTGLLIAGRVINKFRGDRSILDPGLDDLSRRTGPRNFGAPPYLRGMWIDGEDALEVARRHRDGPPTCGAVAGRGRLGLRDPPRTRRVRSRRRGVPRRRTGRVGLGNDVARLSLESDGFRRAWLREAARQAGRDWSPSDDGVGFAAAREAMIETIADAIERYVEVDELSLAR